MTLRSQDAPGDAPCSADKYRGGEGPPLLLLHGLGGTWRVWKPVLGSLIPFRDVLALTLPGHCGGAPLPGGAPPTPALLADLVEAALDGEGVDTPHVAGNSLGGWIALELARRGRARSVVALSPVGLLEPAEQASLIRRLRAGRGLACRIGPAARRLARFGFGRRLLFGEVLHRADRLSPDEALDWMAAYISCPAFEAVLEAGADHEPEPLPQSLGCPVCVAWAAEDRMTPERPFAARFASALPWAARVRLPASGHIPMPDAPGLVAATILAHTGGVQASVAGAAS